MAPIEVQNNVEEVNSEAEIDSDEDVIKIHAKNEIWRLTTTLCIVILISYICGYFQFSILAPLLICLYAIWIWNIKVNRIQNWFYSEHEAREQRKRAFYQSETVEWLNFLLNRWYIC